MTDTSRQYDIGRTDGAAIAATRDSVAVEEPLEIQVSSTSASGAAAKSVSITMRTPGHDAELATGFLFTEGILDHPDQVASVEHVGTVDEQTGLRNTVRVHLADTVPLDLDRLQRHFYTTSSCGVRTKHIWICSAPYASPTPRRRATFCGASNGGPSNGTGTCQGSCGS